MFPWDGTEVRELIAIYMISKLMDWFNKSHFSIYGTMVLCWSEVKGYEGYLKNSPLISEKLTFNLLVLFDSKKLTFNFWALWKSKQFTFN